MLPALFTFFLSLMIIQSGQAQPYIFTTEKVIVADSLRDFSYNDIYKIYKINLANGKKDFFGEGSEFVSWDNTQSWVINGSDRYFGAVIERHYSIMSVSDTIGFLLYVDPEYVVYSPLIKKLFVPGYDDNDSNYITVFNSLSAFFKSSKTIWSIPC
jgi:hypothetical protein